MRKPNEKLISITEEQKKEVLKNLYNKFQDSEVNDLSNMTRILNINGQSARIIFEPRIPSNKMPISKMHLNFEPNNSDNYVVKKSTKILTDLHKKNKLREGFKEIKTQFENEFLTSSKISR